MWNRPHPIVICCVIIVFTAVRANQNEQGPSTTVFDENKFIRYSGYALGSSPTLIKTLSENEELIYILIKDYYHRSVQQSSHLLQPSVKPFQLMHRYLLNFEVTTGQLQLNLKRQKDHSNYRAFKVVWNPLTTYFMLKRFMKPLPEIVRSLDVTKNAQFSLQKQILNIMESTGWPTEGDLSGALSAILRIQHVYDLNTFQISIGNLAGFKTLVNISSVDCLEIGKQALSEAYHYLAIEWFETALWRHKWAPRLSTAEISDSTYPEALEYYIALAKELHDSQWSLDVWDVMFFTTPSTEGRYRRRTSELETWKGNRAPQVVEANYWGTCSGGNYKSENEKSKLFCWYETEVNPLFKINPLKAEILSFEPLLVIQYYDLIGDNMIEKIKQDSSHELRHSTVVSDDIQTSVLTSARTSLNSWINDNKREQFFPIPDIIEAVMLRSRIAASRIEHGEVR